MARRACSLGGRRSHSGRASPPPCPRSPRSFLPSSRLPPSVLHPCDPAASPVSCRSPTAMPPPLRLGSICLGRTRHHRSSLPCSAVPVKHPRRAFTLLIHISYADGALLWALHASASSSSPPLSVAMRGCWPLSHFALALRRPCIPPLRSPLIVQPIRAPCTTQRGLLGQATATTATGTETDRGEWAGRCSDSVGGLLS